jgi:glycosyltransferase involved in cell wall biosynthesis
MKILLLSQSDSGGAGRAARRLHIGLQSQNIDSEMLVEVKSSDTVKITSQTQGWGKLSANLKLRERLDKIPLAFHPQHSRTEFSPQWVPSKLPSWINSLQPDLINLHWVEHGFLQIESMPRLKQPLVWTLHDMWAFTGGCHYTGNCNHYFKQCGNCPQLRSKKSADLSNWIWKRKARAWKSLNLTIVTPSQWLASCVRNSSLFQYMRVEVIPNGLDVKTYKPLDKSFSRRALNLPQDKKLVLFGAMFGTGDRRKGFHLLKPALKMLQKAEQSNQIDLVVFGGGSQDHISELGFNVHILGRLSDESSLALAYSAADVFVAPSTEDNLPNTIMEASACGTPCVGFQIGGIPDLIDHYKTGYLCKPFDVEDLMNGINWILEDTDRRAILGEAARFKVESEFSDYKQSKNYLTLFEEILAQAPKSKRL